MCIALEDKILFRIIGKRISLLTTITQLLFMTYFSLFKRRHSAHHAPLSHIVNVPTLESYS